MDLEKIIEKITKLYDNNYHSVTKRVTYAIDESQNTLNYDLNELNLHEMKSVSNTILDIECEKIHNELEDLIAKKEAIESKLHKKREDLQQIKYEVFNAIESTMNNEDSNTLAKLHQIKLQSIDIFDILNETVESAIITTLERSKDSEASEDIEEVIKEITYEAIKEGSLSTIRTRKILSTILSSAIEISEASPNNAQTILKPTLKGMRSGLLHSIERFKARIAYMPLEAKHILIEDYDNIMEDLNQTDTLFVQVVQTQANESSEEIKKLLVELNQKMHLDLEELVTISKETANVIRTKVSNFTKTAVKKADTALKSEKAKEAKAMGIQAWGIAKEALGSALKSARNAMDKK
ncbi:DUF6781 family protein [Sulfurimonas sp.]|uniref:DUF6781 family protein n=1 Tax=Sulfurimonas sp. TaxID=2022749 RepID=UPI0035699C27